MIICKFWHIGVRDNLSFYNLEIFLFSFSNFLWGEVLSMALHFMSLICPSFKLFYHREFSPIFNSKSLFVTIFLFYYVSFQY